jgi:anaerobic selenocysteine-containing dehydrogenase
MTTVHHRACNLCEAICGLRIEVDGDQILSIRGDPDDPLSRGHICPKATALQDLQHDPDRLVRPLKKRGSSFEEVSWETALDDVAARIAEVQMKHGRSAVALYQGNPTVHSLGALLGGQVFARALKTRSHFSATSLDQLPHMLASLLMFGHQLFLPVPDLDRARFVVVIGANPLASNGSIMTAPGVGRRLKGVQARGGRIVVVDPRRTETAAAADQHILIRPGTDGMLLAALVRRILDDTRASLGRLAPVIEGLDAVRAAVRPFTPERVSAATGVPIDVIAALAEQLVVEKPAVVYGRFGACTNAFGGLTAWLLNVINVVTGNLDEPGGAMFANPAVDLVGLSTRAGARGEFARRKSRVRGLPSFGGELPASTLAEEIDTPGAGQLRALITAAGNPVLSAPQGARLDRALPSLELMVSIDLYVNETTRHAHYILPPSPPLERDHYDVVFHALAVRNTARFSHALFPRREDGRHDWEILTELAARIGPRGVLARTGAVLAQRAFAKGNGPRRLIDAALRAGPHRLSLRALDESPSGVDLGPLTRALPGRLLTRSGKLELAPQALLDDVKRLEAALDAQPEALVLIGRRDLRSNNSWMHNSERLVKGKPRCTLVMNEADAEARGLKDGQQVELSSRTGCVALPLEVTAGIARGVVSMPHGWGHGREGVRLRVAAEHAGASINDVTDAARVDPLSGTASFSGVPVEVKAAPTAS